MRQPVLFVDGDTLLCPKCGSGNLHHSSVTTYFRDCEDGDAIRATMSKRKVDIDRVGTAPGRRDSLQISFWCEHCDGKEYALEICQHKGATEVVWSDLADTK
jgi:hypothetical protein